MDFSLTSGIPAPAAPIVGPARGPTVPAIFSAAGEKATRRLVEFFTAEIRNPNTRAAYARAVARFDRWCRDNGLRLEQLTPVHVAAYVETIGRALSRPTVKQHLAALRMLGDYLVVGQVIPANPAASVRGPRHSVKKGKTPVLTGEEMRQLIDSINLIEADECLRVPKPPDRFTIAELRDRALIAVMVYSFARVSAVLGMDVGDYRQQGRRCFLRLHEKGGKEHEIPCHHQAEGYLDAYLAVAGTRTAGRPRSPASWQVTVTCTGSGQASSALANRLMNSPPSLAARPATGPLRRASPQAWPRPGPGASPPSRPSRNPPA